MMLSGLKRIRIIHRLRVTVALLGFLALVAAIVGLWWANHTGLPDSWRTKIEKELANQGYHTDVESLRYLPLRGIEAGEVVIYADESRSRVIGRLHHLMLDVDRTRLSRGEVKIDQIDLAGARISLAADPADPNSKTLELTDAKGRILISDKRQLEIQNASGMIEGIRLEFDGVLETYHPRPNPTPEEIEYANAQRRKLLTSIIEAFENWGPTSTTPPKIRIMASGDLEEPSSLRTTFEVQGTGLKSQSLDIDYLDLRAELRGPVIVLHQADISTSSGTLAGRGEYDTWKRSGRFETNSTLDVAALLESLGLPIPEKLPSYGKPPILEGYGTFAQGEDGWELKVMGKIELDQPSYKHLSADHASSSFSWDGKQLFLEDLEIREGEHELYGRVFITADEILYQARTDLPPPFWQNAVTIQPLSKILDNFSSTDETTVFVDFEGRAVPGDKSAWRFSGEAAATNISYRGVAAKKASVTLDLKRVRQDYINTEVEFDYRDYPLRKAHGGPASGSITVDLIRWEREPGTVTIRKLKGEAWPGQITRTFSPKLAETLERYGFHSNPGLEANGVVGVKHGKPKQNLTVRFASNKPVDYDFLGTTLKLQAPRGTVRVLPNVVQANDLSFGLFGGTIRGSLEAQIGEGGNVGGEIDWTRVSLPALSSAYGFKSQPKGQITGRLDFDLVDRKIAGLSGVGHIALENGELFEVPIFGPLSPVISAVLGNRKSGFQEANEAFCTFNIKKGTLTTLDFKTATSSLVFTGDAVVDLAKQTLQMTLRMNARGLFGVITLPLRPFYGIFQFRGAGPIQKPEWTNVMFTRPPKQQEETLLEPPKAREVKPPAAGR
ncbi:AsmA-like C-terminal region-containing protein [Haloferula sp.]|uniref:AsmA-like C-terminal region-containing protein n=1 Tax=Haloferula sp. TaxID=2497595 RepID=UPI00329C15D9